MLDERVPEKPFIDIAHSVFNGGHYVYVAPPFRDASNTPSRIFTFYILQHLCAPDVQQFSLYDHGLVSKWSMLAPIKRLMEPVDAARFFMEQVSLLDICEVIEKFFYISDICFRFQPKYGIRLTRHQQISLYGIGPTRAIHVQDGILNDKYGHERHLLFRVTDDGSIWVESVRVADDSDLKEKALYRASDELRARLVKVSKVPRFANKNFTRTSGV